MNRRRLVLTLGCVAGLIAAVTPANAAQPAVVSHIDHFVVEDSQAAELFKLLSEQFKLPVIWPISNYGPFRSGGVYFGNAVVEVGHFEGAVDSGHARWQGIVFAPQESATASVQELDSRHIVHDPANDYAPNAQDGKPAPPLWTTIRIRDKGQGDFGIIICDYHFDTKTGVRAAADNLAKTQGGPLGLLGVREVSIETSDWIDAGARWQNLLAPLSQVSAGTFSFESGPAIHLLRGTHDAIRSLTLEVSSLERAEAFLSEQSIAYDVHGGKLTIQQGLHGLSLHIVAGAT
jgi:hypothetical protein